MVLVSRRGRWVLLALASVIAGAGWRLLPASSALRDPAAWQRLALPGALSHAHAELENDCGACHRSVVGVEDSKCVACHVSNERLLTWPETIFHASIQQCGTCHLEHGGRGAEISVMDHAQLATTALAELERGSPPETSGTASHLAAMLAERKGRPEAANLLRCDGCHARKDVHEALFGSQWRKLSRDGALGHPCVRAPVGSLGRLRAVPPRAAGSFRRALREDGAKRRPAMRHVPPAAVMARHRPPSVVRSRALEGARWSWMKPARARRSGFEVTSKRGGRISDRPGRVCHVDPEEEPFHGAF